jgi:steroid delta-isomerase
MAGNTDAEIRHVYERWHETVVGRDLDGLMALYAEDRSWRPLLIVATLKDKPEGILRGKAEIRPFFKAGIQKLRGDFGRWHRTGTFFSNGRQLTWEYPRETPHGDQVDLVEMMDIANGLITHHRVYWGWVRVQDARRRPEQDRFIGRGPTLKPRDATAGPARGDRETRAARLRSRGHHVSRRPARRIRASGPITTSGWVM